MMSKDKRELQSARLYLTGREERVELMNARIRMQGARTSICMCNLNTTRAAPLIVLQASKQVSVANRLRRLDRVVLWLGSKEKGANIDSNGRAVVSQNERLNALNALDNGREAWYLATAYLRVKTGERESCGYRKASGAEVENSNVSRDPARE